MLKCATGVQVSVRQFVEMTAKELGIELAFEGDGEQEIARVTALNNPELKCKIGDVVVRVDPRYFRPTEVETLLGDPTKAKQKLGWSPTTSLQQLVSEMAQSDFVSAKRDSLVKAHGFATFDHHE
jgi:GDPmannose 4,6-dehydratase